MSRLLSSFLLLAGCQATPGADAGELTGFPSCDAIIEACHDYDTGIGGLAECHDLAHDATAEETCAPERTRCVEICEAAAADADGEDAGASVDAGS